MSSSSQPGFLAEIWQSRKKRGIILQVALLAAIGWIFYVIATNTIANLKTRGIASGFSFLNQEAGFEVSFSLIDYTPESTVLRVFVLALLNTLLVSSLGIVIATILGFLLGIARLSKNWLLRNFSLFYIETIRNIPLLLQIFFWYYAVIQTLPSARESFNLGDAFFLNLRGLYLPKPDSLTLWVFILGFIAFLGVNYVLRAYARRKMALEGKEIPVFWLSLAALIALPVLGFVVSGGKPQFEYATLTGFNFEGGWVIIPELVALLVALALYTAAFIAEIVRAGILAVPKGQIEAADALGLKRGYVTRFVVIPQALRVIIPPLTNQYLNLTKNSSLAAAVGYPDLVLLFASVVLGQVGQAVEVVGMVMISYLLLSLAISVVMNWYNRKTAFVGK